MPNRCTDCNKFASLETQDPEVNSLEIDATSGRITGEVYLLRQSACCSSDMSDYTFEIDDTPDSVAEHAEAHENGEIEGDADFEIEEDSVELVEDANRVDRKGKPITNPRYMALLLGFTLNATVTCANPACSDWSETVTFSETERASGFNELT